MVDSADVKVSVVVPVYNAGEYLDPCVESLLRQTIAPGELELVFVDDGSTDGTGERLDRLVDGHDHVRVVHIDNTGGPGGPRNLGLDGARGEYVYFLDCDDWLEPEALERMRAMAVRNGSDVVVGKLVGHGRGVSRALFQRSRDDADILRDHLLLLMTPHKLFRTAFLREHGLRFPEGPVRLEDHRFVLAAYFKAATVSVLADHPCCHWVQRDDGGNYTAGGFDPVHYFAMLDELLDIVDEHVGPGPRRNRFYAHYLRTKMLQRMGGGKLLRMEPAHRRDMYEAVRDLLVKRFPTEVDRLLPRAFLPRAALVRAGAYDDLTALAEAERGITVHPGLDGSGHDGDALELTLTGRLAYRDGTPVAFDDEGGRVRWRLPATLTSPLPPEALDVTEALPQSRLATVLRHTGTQVEVSIPTTTTRVGDPREVALAGTAVIPGDRRLDPGDWELRVHLNACGWTAEKPVRDVRVRVSADGSAAVVDAPDASGRRTGLRRAAVRMPGARRAAQQVRKARRR